MPCKNWKCCEIVKQKIISLKDKKSITKFILKNEFQISLGKVKLDECNDYKYIGKRCDFVINCNEKNFTLFIELKGQNIKHAVKQLNNSIKALKKFSCKNIYAFVILTRCPQTTTEIQKIKKDFKKKGITFENKNLKLTKKLDNL